MNGTHQVLAYADDVNLLGDDIRTTERNAEVLLNACKNISKNIELGCHPLNPQLKSQNN